VYASAAHVKLNTELKKTLVLTHQLRQPHLRLYAQHLWTLSIETTSHAHIHQPRK